MSGEPKKKIWRAPWSPAAGQRLRLAIAASPFTQSELRDENGQLIKRPTMTGWLTGAQAPPMAKLEAICRQLAVDVRSIISDPDELRSVADSRRSWGAEMLDRIAQLPARQNIIDVPVYDIEVAAGHGRQVWQERPIDHWPLPVSWVAEHAGENPKLAIFSVRGDSQEPELRDGDALIVDRNQTKLRAGMHVVRRDDDLLVKRVQLEGRKVMLLSANPGYETVTLDREADGDSFEVIGRAIGAIKVLS